MHHVAYLFCRIEGREGARTWLRGLLGGPTGEGAPRHVQTAEDWKGAKIAAALNLAFTYGGLRELGWADAFACFADFSQGMLARARDQCRDAGGSDPEYWQEGLREEAHLLLTLYWEREDDRERGLEELRQGLSGSGVTEVACQLADARAEPGMPPKREHFGFRDGFSQPVIEGSGSGRSVVGEGVRVPRLLPIGRSRWRPLRLGEFLLGHLDEDGVVAGGSDPHGVLRNGSFMVWRKLEQDVERFEEAIEQAADGPDERRLLRAKVVGRWPNGTSLVDAPYAEPLDRDPRRRPANSFDYGTDGDGARCPLGAHVRRANPRTSLKYWTERTRRHRIIRRGVSYDERASGRGYGLIFVCFNASIARQFELIQGSWLMDGDAFGLGAERDFMLGAGESNGKATIQGDRARPARFVHAPRQPLVTTRGGYYLFLPGIAALRTILAGSAPPAV
jgi:Dyp-type peroxidase family